MLFLLITRALEQQFSSLKPQHYLFQKILFTKIRQGERWRNIFGMLPWGHDSSPHGSGQDHGQQVFAENCVALILTSSDWHGMACNMSICRKPDLLTFIKIGCKFQNQNFLPCQFAAVTKICCNRNIGKSGDVFLAVARLILYTTVYEWFLPRFLLWCATGGRHWRMVP